MSAPLPPAVVPWPHPAAQDVTLLLRDCQMTRTRRGGPGGQHRNRVESAIVIEHRPTGITTEAAERRSQESNRRVAVTRLRMKLALEHREPVDPDRRPSDLWRSRCRGGRIVCSTEHADYPALLAEALDVLEAHGMDVPSSAERLGCSASQLVRFLRAVPAALEWLNRFRRSHGWPPYR